MNQRSYMQTWSAVARVLSAILPIVLFSGCAALLPTWEANRKMAVAMADQMLPEFKNVKRVRLSVGKVSGLASASMFGETCYVSFDADYLAGIRSSSELAFVIAHEVAHCDHGDVSFIVLIDHTHRKEFLADRRAHEVVKKFNFGDVTTLDESDLPIFLRHTTRESSSHPSGTARYAALASIRRNVP